jgi:cellulose synthase/poly-beta-1,6-N-acetylglucosamine synthase-like glycosyltransferase
MEARLGATLTASGAIFAARRECYRPIPNNAILDDFITPMNARRLGYRVLYDPEAVGTEIAADTVAGEFTRRVRLAAGSFRALPYLIRTPLKGFALVAFLSHKLMRWMVCFPLIGMFVSTVLLLQHPLYRVLFAGEVAFLLWAGLGLAFRDRLQRIPGALLGYFLFAMNAAFLIGFVKAVSGRDIAWHRTT